VKRRIAVGILSLTFGFDLGEHVGDPTTNRGSLFGGTVPLVRWANCFAQNLGSRSILRSCKILTDHFLQRPSTVK